MSNVIPIKSRKQSPPPLGSRVPNKISLTIPKPYFRRMKTVLRQIKKKKPKTTMTAVFKDTIFNDGLLTTKQKSFIIGRDWTDHRIQITARFGFDPFSILAKVPAKVLRMTVVPSTDER